MSTPRDTQLEQAAVDFVAAFEFVFEHDWHYSRLCLQAPDTLTEPGHSFLNPGQFNEGCNWSGRRALLNAYRELAEALMRRGIHPDQQPADLPEG